MSVNVWYALMGATQFSAKLALINILEKEIIFFIFSGSLHTSQNLIINHNFVTLSFTMAASPWIASQCLPLAVSFTTYIAA